MRVVDGLCVVKVHIGLKDYDFLLDSGAAGIVIDPSIVDDAHLETYGSRVGATIGTFNETNGIVPLMPIGGLRMRSVVARVVAVPFHLDDHTHIAGLLGFDFFADAVVHVDFDHGIANAIAPAAFKPPADAVPLPIALDDRTPVVRARVRRAPPAASCSIPARTARFSRRRSPRAPTSRSTRRRRSRSSAALGGTGTAATVRLKSFDIAGAAALATRSSTSAAPISALKTSTAPPAPTSCTPTICSSTIETARSTCGDRARFSGGGANAAESCAASYVRCELGPGAPRRRRGGCAAWGGAPFNLA